VGVSTVGFRTAGVKAAGTGAVSVSNPSGFVAGDLDILFAEVRDADTASITANGGTSWTALSGSPFTVTGGEKLYVWWRLSQSGDSAPTVTPSADHVCAMRLAAAAGTFDVTDPIGYVQSGSESTVDASFSFSPGNSTDRGDVMMVCAATCLADSNTGQVPVMTNANLQSTTSRANYSTNSGAGGGFGITTGNLHAAGAVGTFACTMSSSSAKSYVSFGLRAFNSMTITQANETDSTANYGTCDPTLNTTSGDIVPGTGISATGTGPTGLQVGDLLIAFVATRYDQRAGIGISGGTGSWTLMAADSNGTGAADEYVAVYMKVVTDAAESGSTYTAVASNINVTNNTVVANVVAVRCGYQFLARLADAIEASQFTNQSGTGTSRTATGVTTIRDASVVFVASAANVNLSNYFSAWAATSPAALTELNETTTSQGSDMTVGSAAAARTTAGATGSVTWTVSVGSNSADWVLAVPKVGYVHKAVTLTPVTETSAPQALDYELEVTSIFVSLSGPVTESSSAVAQSEYKAVDLTRATETVSAVALDVTKPIYKDLTTAAESDAAVAQSAALALSLSTAQETDAAQSLSALKAVTITPVTEIGLAHSIGLPDVLSNLVFLGIRSDDALTSAWNSGDFTMAALVKPNWSGSDQALMVTYGADGNDAHVYFIRSNAQLSLFNGSQNSFGPSLPDLVGSADSQNWLVLVLTKTAGTTTPRFHYIELAPGASWTHANGDTAIGDPAANVGGGDLSGGYVVMGDYDTSNTQAGGVHGGGTAWFKGDYGMASFFPVAMSDAEVEELADDLKTSDWYQDTAGTPEFLSELISLAPVDLLGNLTLTLDDGGAVVVDAVGPSGWQFDGTGPTEITVSLTPVTESSSAVTQSAAKHVRLGYFAFADAFDNDDLDPDHWFTTGFGITEAGDTVAFEYAGAPFLGLADIINFYDGSAAIEVASVETADPSCSFLFALQSFDSSYSAYIWESDGTLHLVHYEEGGADHGTDVAYDAGDHRWWRIREADCTVYLETSPDGESWTTHESQLFPPGTWNSASVYMTTGNAGAGTPPDAEVESFALTLTGNYTADRSMFLYWELDALVADKYVDLTPVTETSATPSLAAPKSLVPVTETASALALTPSKSVTRSPVSEADSAVTLVHSKTRSISPVTETDIARGQQRISISPVSEADAPINDFPQPPPASVSGVGTSTPGLLSCSILGPDCNVGDLLLMVISEPRGQPIHTPVITGGANGTWTLLHSAVDGSAANSQRGLFYGKIAQAGDGRATYLVSGPSIIPTSQYVLANILCIRLGRGQNLNRIRRDSSTGDTTAAALTHTIAGVTSKKANELIVALVAAEGALGRDTYTSTNPASYTERFDDRTTLGPDATITAASASRATGGATGSISYNSTGSATKDIATLVLSLVEASFIEKQPPAITPAAETTTLPAQTYYRSVTLTPVTETNRPQGQQRLTLTPVLEVNSVRGQHRVTLTPVEESSTTQAQIAAHALSVTPTGETDGAEAVTFTKTIHKTLSWVTEPNEATELTGSKPLGIGIVTETNTVPVALTISRSVDPVPVVETNVATAIAQSGIPSGLGRGGFAARPIKGYVGHARKEW